MKLLFSQEPNENRRLIQQNVASLGMNDLVKLFAACVENGEDIGIFFSTELNPARRRENAKLASGFAARLKESLMSSEDSLNEDGKITFDVLTNAGNVETIKCQFSLKSCQEIIDALDANVLLESITSAHQFKELFEQADLETQDRFYSIFKNELPDRFFRLIMNFQDYKTIDNCIPNKYPAIKAALVPRPEWINNSKEFLEALEILEAKKGTEQFIQLANHQYSLKQKTLSWITDDIDSFFSEVLRKLPAGKYPMVLKLSGLRNTKDIPLGFIIGRLQHLTPEQQRAFKHEYLSLSKINSAAAFANILPTFTAEVKLNDQWFLLVYEELKNDLAAKYVKTSQDFTLVVERLPNEKQREFCELFFSRLFPQGFPERDAILNRVVELATSPSNSSPPVANDPLDNYLKNFKKKHFSPAHFQEATSTLEKVIDIRNQCATDLESELAEKVQDMIVRREKTAGPVDMWVFN